MYHTCLAKEQAETEKSSDSAAATCRNVRLKYLNYAPGPLETTDMTMQLRSAPDLDGNLKTFFQKNKLIDPIDSARVLVRLVLDDAFESGQHIDYYDMVQSARPQHVSSNNKDTEE
jgi:hypothetical protein